jgi:NAD(P)-dependent dehydrogenase (short-subunit alcohol dehydrogenase family)
MMEYERTGNDFTAKVAIVTGGGSGIGRATAILLARRGAKVVVGDVNDAAAAEVVAVIERAGGVAVYQPTDVRRDTACEALVACAVDRFGQLDIAFNNAGIIDNPPARTADMDPSAWQRVIDVNLTGIFNCMRHELKVMEQRGGCIVNTSSTSGIRGIRGGAAYCASKHGVIGLTRAAALEYGRFGIRVNAVCPGFVDTALVTGEDSVFTPERVELALRSTALRRLGEPEEIARLVVWLCSAEASFVTGAHYVVDGGMTAG